MSKIVLYSNKHRADDNRIIELEARALQRANHDVVVFGRTGGIDNLPHDVNIKECGASRKTIYSQCIAENADLYIFQDPELLGIAYKLHKNGFKTVFDSHENYEEKFKTRFANKFPYLKFAKRIISKAEWMYEKKCISKLDGRIVADRIVQAKYGKNTFMLPNMPSRKFYEALPTRETSHNKFCIYYVGTLTWDRGIVETIKAIQLCKNDNIEFHVIGSTKDEALIQYIKSADKTIFHGRVKWEDLKKYLVNADLGVVLLQPVEAYLYYPGENIVKLWEYMSIGVPVLLPDFPALEELNKQLKFGKCVKSDDISAIAEMIDWFIEHPDERTTMGENGRREVRSKYNAENFEFDFIKYIDAILQIKFHT